MNFFEKKLFFQDFFANFGGFSVDIKERNPNEKFGWISLKFTVIIVFKKRVFTVCYDKKRLLYLVDYNYSIYSCVYICKFNFIEKQLSVNC